MTSVFRDCSCDFVDRPSWAGKRPTKSHEQTRKFKSRDVDTAIDYGFLAGPRGLALSHLAERVDDVRNVAALAHAYDMQAETDEPFFRTANQISEHGDAVIKNA